jgi:hypothetical protein
MRGSKPTQWLSVVTTNFGEHGAESPQLFGPIEPDIVRQRPSKALQRKQRQSHPAVVTLEEAGPSPEHVKRVDGLTVLEHVPGPSSAACPYYNIHSR